MLSCLYFYILVLTIQEVEAIGKEKPLQPKVSWSNAYELTVYLFFTQQKETKTWWFGYNLLYIRYNRVTQRF